jgi:hypothetical protein
MNGIKVLSVALLQLFFTFTLNAQGVIVLNQTSPACTNFGGSITFSINSTNGPFDVYQNSSSTCSPTLAFFTTSANTITINSIPPCNTSYTFTFFDFSNTKIDTIIRQFPDPSPCLSLFATCSSATCNVNCAQTATAFANGTPPYSYTWTPVGINSATIANACAGTYTIFGKDAMGLEGVISLIILPSSVACVGIREHYLDNSVSLYPNPVSNTLKIKLENERFETGEIEISNSFGQTILKLPYSKEIDISFLNAGLYFLKIFSSNKHIYYSKFMKE